MLTNTQSLPTRFHIMIKPIGPLCNLNCSYCFYLHKKEILPTSSNWRMSDELLETFIKQYIQEQSCNEIVFSWQGGEPTLLGIDFFKKAIYFEKKYAQGKIIENDLQTNGTLLNTEWCKFLKKNNFLVGLSIDGPKELHDKHRYDKNGNSTFNRVYEAAELLKKHKIPFNALVTIHQDNVKNPLKVYRFLRDVIKPGIIQFNSCVEHKEFTTLSPKEWDVPSFPELNSSAAKPGRSDSIVTEWSVDPDRYGSFLCEVFDEWYKYDIGKTFVCNFEYALSLWLGNPMGVACEFAPICGKSLAIEHNGEVFTCDHLVYPKYRLGNIKEKTLGSMAFSNNQVKFGYEKRDEIPQYCLDCKFLFACNGGCPKNRILRSPVGEPGLNYLCSGLKKYFGHIDPYMRKLANEIRMKKQL